MEVHYQIRLTLIFVIPRRTENAFYYDQLFYSREKAQTVTIICPFAMSDLIHLTFSLLYLHCEREGTILGFFSLWWGEWWSDEGGEYHVIMFLSETEL